MTTPVTLSTASPYVGPRAFDEGDQGIFFGRDTESRQLAALVIAHRAVLLYAQSGAGKTSLLQASLVPELKRRKRLETLPIGRVGGEARGDVANLFVYNTLLNVYGRDARPEDLARVTLSQGLAPFLAGEGDGSRPQPRLLILDQFEELFTSHTERYADRSDFFTQLNDCLIAYPALRLLLSMREDYIAHLDAYAGHLPDRLRIRFRLERLGPEAALSAVVDPLDGTGRGYAPGVPEALVDNLRRVQRRVVTQEGSDLAQVLDRYVEPVHLQIVCRQLWDNLPPERELIELDDVQQFGDVDQALTEFYERALQSTLPAAGMGERRLRRWFDAELITPAGTRGLLFRGDTETAGLPNPALDVLVNSYVVRADIRGGDTWYELSHDRLVEPILAANRAWREAHANPLAAAVEAWQLGGESGQQLALGTQLAELETYAEEYPDDITADERRFLDESRREEDRRQRRAAQRNQRRVLIGALVIVAILAGFTIWALFNAVRASEAQAAAEANEQKAITAQEEANELRETAQVGATGEAIARGTAEAGATEQAVLRVTSEWNADLAVASEAQAVAAREETELLKTSIQASQLASASRVELDTDPELALLLATAGLGLGRQVDTEASFYAAVFSSFRGSMRGHDARVRAAIFSPDGKRLLTAGDDGTARLWDLSTEELAVLERPAAFVWAVAFSPDGERVVTAGCDETNESGSCTKGSARLWDLTGQELADMAGHTDVVNTVSFSPDGERILTASEDGTARLWDLSGEELAVFAERGWLSSAVFSPDGQRVVTAGFDGPAHLWDLTGAELALLTGHETWINAVTFSPDGQRIAAASQDMSARLWDLNGTPLAILEGHGDEVRSIAFSPDGNRIVTASWDRTARLWNLDGEELALLEGHTDGVNSAAFSPDGRQIVTAGFDGTARIWDLDGGEIAVLDGHKSWVFSAVFSPNGRQIVTASFDGTARIWDLGGGELADISALRASVSSVAFSPDGKRVVTAGDDGTSRVWDLTGRRLAVLEGHADDVNSAVFSPDGELVVTAGCDEKVENGICPNGSARLWDLGGAERAVLRGHAVSVEMVAFSPNGELIVTAGCDETSESGFCAKGTARLWNLAGAELAVLEGHDSSVLSASFSPDGERVVTTGEDGTAQLWNLTGERLAILEGHNGSVFFASFSPDGKRILTAGHGEARLWDMFGEELNILAGHGNRVYAASFSPGGERVVTAGDGGLARIWDSSGKQLVALSGHRREVISAEFSPDGERVLTASRDGTTRLWDLAGEELVVLDRYGFWATAAAFSPDGQWIATAGMSPTSIHLWPSYLSLESKVAVARERLSRGFTDDECLRFFRDDLDSCPKTVEELFALFDGAEL